MRTIQISTDVFAALWAARIAGENSEEDILRRMLKVRIPKEPTPTNGIGFTDPRYGVKFPEGFEIYRTYLGSEYRAKAVAGSWLLINTGDMHPTLNALSTAIGAKTENAWINWFFDDEGKRRPVSDLRDATRIGRRRK